MSITTNAPLGTSTQKVVAKINLGGADFTSGVKLLELFYDNNQNKIVLGQEPTFYNVEAMQAWLIEQGVLIDSALTDNKIFIGQTQHDLNYNFDDFFGYSTTTDQFTGIGSSLITQTGGPGFMTLRVNGNNYSIFSDGTAPVAL